MSVTSTFLAYGPDRWTREMAFTAIQRARNPAQRNRQQHNSDQQRPEPERLPASSGFEVKRAGPNSAVWLAG